MAARLDPDVQFPVALFQLYKQIPTENHRHREHQCGRHTQIGGDRATAKGPENTQDIHMTTHRPTRTERSRWWSLKEMLSLEYMHQIKVMSDKD